MEFWPAVLPMLRDKYALIDDGGFDLKFVIRSELLKVISITNCQLCEQITKRWSTRQRNKRFASGIDQSECRTQNI